MFSKLQLAVLSGSLLMYALVEPALAQGAAFHSQVPRFQQYQAQALPILSTEGKEFLVYPSRVDDLWDRINLYITTRSTSPLQVRIYTPKLPTAYGGVDYQLSVSASQPRTQEVNTRGTNNARGKLLGGIRVVADGDIAVFVNNPSSNATGVTSILSTESLGTHYIFPSIPRSFNGQVSICIGSLEERNTVTSVTVTLHQNPSQGKPLLNYKDTDYWPGDTIPVTLNPYEFADIRDVTSTGDLTGTVIHADSKVAVFSSAVFHLNLHGIPFLSVDRDIVIENIPPKSAWGKKFIVTSTPSQTAGDFIRVLAGEPDVTVRMSSGHQFALGAAGQFHEMSLDPGDSFILEADKPIEVVQYRYSFANDSAPFMFLVPPLESYTNEFNVPVIFNDQNYIVLNTHVCHADRITLRHNHTPQSKEYISKLSSWKPVADGSYVTSLVKVGVGFVTLAMEPSGDTLEDEMAVFGGYVFGQGPQKAYASALGLRMMPETPLFTYKVPDYKPVDPQAPIVDGHSKLVWRNKLPMALPLKSRDLRSRVECHHECWTHAQCVYVAVRKEQNSEADSCRLYGSTARCSGLKDAAGFLLYKLSK